MKYTFLKNEKNFELHINFKINKIFFIKNHNIIKVFIYIVLLGVTTNFLSQENNDKFKKDSLIKLIKNDTSIINKLESVKKRIQKEICYTCYPSAIIRLYSNFKKIDNDPTPSLIQTDFLFNVPFVSVYLGKRSSLVRLYLFDNVIFPHLQLNRLNKNNSFVVPNYFLISEYDNNQIKININNVSYFDIFQYAYLRMNLKFNLLTINFNDKSILRFDYFFAYNRTRASVLYNIENTSIIKKSYFNRFKDSIKNYLDIDEISSYWHGFNLFWITKYKKLRLYNKFSNKFLINCSAGITIGFYKVATSNLELIEIRRKNKFYENKEIIENSTSLNNFRSVSLDKFRNVSSTFIEFNIKNIKENDNSSEIWLRSNFYFNYFFMANNKNRFYNDFFQILIGTSVFFDDIMDFLKKESPNPNSVYGN